MILDFAVENYKSFNDVTRLSMISASKYQDFETHKLHVKNVNVLKNALIYGPNASGKSNLILALNFLLDALANGLNIDSKRDYCRTYENNIDKKTSFDLLFSFKEKIYSFGFSAYLNKSTVVDEWLYEYVGPKTKKIIYEIQDGNMDIDKLKNIAGKDKKRVEVYADDYKDHTNLLFITFLFRNLITINNKELKNIYKVYMYLLNSHMVIFPNSKFTKYVDIFENDMLGNFSKILCSFDTGITDINKKEVKYDELERDFDPDDLRKHIINTIKSIKENDIKYAYASIISNNNFYNMKIDENGPVEIETLLFKHYDSDIFDFVFGEESDGTKRLFDLIPMLLPGYENCVFLVDELERSLHPKLSIKFVELFNEIHKEDQAQLIFTTHDTNLFSTNYFRRDEFWLMDKNDNNSSDLYPLSKFVNRDSNNLDRKYMDGRYGALPLFGDYESD